MLRIQSVTCKRQSFKFHIIGFCHSQQLVDHELLLPAFDLNGSQRLRHNFGCNHAEHAIADADRRAERLIRAFGPGRRALGFPRELFMSSTWVLKPRHAIGCVGL
jgi:hypothetical protein